MKKNLLFLSLSILMLMSSCNRRYYTSSDFNERTEDHKAVAILPAEMLFTGKQPKNLSEEDIERQEERESISFQYALYNSILRNANTRKYRTGINFQDIHTTQKLLKENGISVRESWKLGDEELARLLGVDAVIKMRIQKNRIMSDEASYGITVAKQVIYNSGSASKIPRPNVPSRTYDIYASCDLISEGLVLWNNHYKAGSDYNSPPHEVIENITENFGRNFPYKRKRRR